MTQVVEREVEESASLVVPSAAAGDSLTVASWTMVSRITGLVRIAATGAVLGPTVLGNTFQFTNTLPNLLYYGLLAGSLFSSILVPALVRHVDQGDQRAASRLASGFLSVSCLGLLVVVPVALVLMPLLVGLTSISGDQVGTAQVLFLMFAPQVFCYAVVGTATAAMNAHRRFALAAAAPAMENVGIIVVLAVTGLAYSPGRVPSAELLLLGLGTTAAVAAHAALQWWGARRCGIRLALLPGWRDPEVRVLLRRSLRSVGQAGLLALQVLVLLTVANHRAGGVVAFQISLSFVYLAVAVAVTPVALACLPRLARLQLRGEGELLHGTFVRGIELALFLAVPAVVGGIVLSSSLAASVTVGRMSTADGRHQVAGCVIALLPAVLGQAVFQLCSYTSYAQEDTRLPLLGAAVQALTCITGALLSLALLGDGDLLMGLGAAYSAGTAAGGGYLLVRLRRRLVRGGERLRPSLVRTSVAAAVMVVPTWTVVALAPHLLSGRVEALLSAVAGAVVGAGAYGVAHLRLGSPELGWLRESLSGRLRSREVPA